MDDRSGKGRVASINGEDRLNFPDGRTLSIPRAWAAADFNAGRL
ncbi:hypothetical protein [Aphanothece microscopica]